ncbi:ZIP-like iron-zinc transporter [Crassisporium funariophilum]|nr:ZIP-like iron-zinc transporter [Crassisporium funariophilum]
MLQLLVMSALLAATSFAVGMLPLSYAFSKSHLERLSALGTGLLLGAALGVIIPEGLETISEANPGALPTGRIALSLVIGFILMLVIEQLISPNAHSHSFDDIPVPLQKTRPSTGVSELEFDAELGDLEPGGHSSDYHADVPTTPIASDVGAGRERAFALLLGLSIHGLADGLALGVANLAKSATGATNTLSFVVFLALILHKAPTSLAFMTSIISTNFPRPECKKYLAIFSASTPLSAIASYSAFSFFGGGDKGDLTGIALLVSGGTFLYVATVLQPVSNHSPHPGDMRPASRVLCIAIGMFIPLTLSALFDHGH